MQVFNAKIRLGGSVLHEVRKQRITVPEVTILRAVHGPDAVVDIELVDDIEIDPAAEWNRLARIYGPTKIRDGDDERPVMSALFGIAGASSLPETLAGFQSEKPVKATGGRRKAAEGSAEADFG